MTPCLLTTTRRRRMKKTTRNRFVDHIRLQILPNVSSDRCWSITIFVLILVIVSSALPVECQGIISDDDLNRATITTLAKENGAKIFEGEKEEVDNFHGQVVVHEGSLLVGARNVLYNISLASLQEQHRFVWSSTESVIELCKLKDQPKEKCHNFIKIILEKPSSSSSSSSSSSAASNKTYLICGTNSYKPMCKTLSQSQEGGAYSLGEDEEGRGISPPDPEHNSTAIYHGDKLVAASVADLNSRDPLIYSSPLRTQKQNSLHLNEPHFVGSLSHEDKLYFFFREIAIENINCGKAIFSRVARVCPTDKGGARIMKTEWTTFFKTRLNCSLPGEFPFYFDEIQSISEMGRGNLLSTLLDESSLLVYAVFSTPRNGLRGSAVCAFKMADVVKSFGGKFKERKDDFSIWLTATAVPEPHPAFTCPNNSTTLSDQALNFIQSHPLMDSAVPSQGGRPALVQTSLKYSFTQVAVDWKFLAANRHYYDVIFVGTDDGRVFKSFNVGKGRDVAPRLVEVMTTPSTKPVIGLKVFVSPEDGEKRLLIVTEDLIVSAPLHRCSAALSCSSCIALKDPYCSWSMGRCAQSHSGMQSLDSGRHSKCPAETHSSQAVPSSKILSFLFLWFLVSASMHVFPESAFLRLEFRHDNDSFSNPACKMCRCVPPDDDPSRDATTPGEDDTTTDGIAGRSSNDGAENVAKHEYFYAGMCVDGKMECVSEASTTKNWLVLVVALGVCSLVVGVVAGVCFANRSRVYKYGLSVAGSFRRQMGKPDDPKEESRSKKSQNFYETGPPSSSSSHRPIIPSQYWIRSHPYQDESLDRTQRRNQMPSNSSSFTFISPTFPPCGDPPTPPSIAKLPLKLNIFNFVKDKSPADEALACSMSAPFEGGAKENCEAEFPFIDGVHEKAESTFHNLFDVTPTTPLADGGAVFSETEAPPSKRSRSFLGRLQRNRFLTDSFSKVRLLLGSGSEVHL